MSEDIRQIFESTDYATLATVCEDGSPWNVPLRFAYDESLFYFRSPPGTIHGSNIERSGRISIVIIDTLQVAKGAVYLHTTAQKVNGEEEQIAVAIFNKRFNNPPDQWPVTEYYKAEIGSLDQARTIGKMFYFDARGEV